LQEIIHYSTAVEHFSLKRVWTYEGKLNREFLELLNGKVPLGGDKPNKLVQTNKTLKNQGFSRILFFKILNFKASTSWDKKLRDF